MTKVGLPGAKEGWQKTDVTMATVLKGQGYAQVSLVKIIRVIAMNIYQPCTDSMSF